MTFTRKSDAPVGGDRADPALFDGRSYAGLVAWWDARHVAGIGAAAPADDAAVATWTDLSGNGRDLAQATEANRPLYRAPGNGGIAMPRLDFDGSNDTMATSASTAWHAPVSVYAVTQFDAAGSMWAEVSANINSNDGWYLYTSTSYTLATGGSGGVTGCDAASSSWAGTSPFVLSFTLGLSTPYWTLHKDGVPLTLTRAAGTGSTSGSSSQPLHVGTRGGTSFPFNGFIACMAVYSGIHGAATRAAVEASLAATFGL